MGAPAPLDQKDPQGGDWDQFLDQNQGGWGQWEWDQEAENNPDNQHTGDSGLSSHSGPADMQIVMLADNSQDVPF
ncbi:hypothetical protein E2562_019522 [Oryza meyeriana var. granulata]|uniref:Uncharacterized protein n=1 Tax=Oryza meyeriana var. granulata TaxID=110450 RepID=A0A6G1CIG8_9ORYZ|nr:hypothetical protein E2562_019522 [Oryza meyeriana var. granulata]